MAKKKNKKKENSITNVDNNEGRIMSMLNGMMMNGGNNMNNQFTNPNIATQAQHVLQQAVTTGQQFVPVDIAQQQAQPNQQQFIDPNAQQNVQAAAQAQQQTQFTNPNTANQAQAQFANNQQTTTQAQNVNKENDNMELFDKMKRALNDDNENKNGKEDNNNESSVSIIEEHPFISTALGVVGGVLLGKYLLFDNDSTDNSSNIIDDSIGFF